MRKSCSKCGKVKDFEDFYFQRGKPKAECKECSREYRRSKSKGISRGKKPKAYFTYPVDDQLICIKCKRKLHVDNFHNSKRSRGKSYWCKHCTALFQGSTLNYLTLADGSKTSINTCYVYGFLKNEKFIYIGSTKTIHSRMVGHKTSGVVNEADQMLIIEFPSELEMLITELNLIAYHKPPFNSFVPQGDPKLDPLLTWKEVVNLKEFKQP